MFSKSSVNEIHIFSSHYLSSGINDVLAFMSNPPYYFQVDRVTLRPRLKYILKMVSDFLLISVSTYQYFFPMTQFISRRINMLILCERTAIARQSSSTDLWCSLVSNSLCCSRSDLRRCSINFRLVQNELSHFIRATFDALRSNPSQGRYNSARQCHSLCWQSCSSWRL